MSRISNLLKRGKARVAALRGRPSITARTGRGSRIVLHCAKGAFREMGWHLPRPGRRPSLRGKARSRLRQGLRSQPPKAAEAVDPEDAALLEADLSQGIWLELKLLAEFEYRAKSAEGKVRYPIFKGLRADHGQGAWESRRRTNYRREQAFNAVRARCRVRSI